MNKNFDQIIQALLSKYREASKKSKYATVGVVSMSVLFFSLLGFRSIRPSIRLLPGPVQTQTSSNMEERDLDTNMEERDLDTQETPFVFVEEHKNDDEKNQKKEDQSIKETRLVTTDQPPRSSFLRKGLWKYLAIPVAAGLGVKYGPKIYHYLVVWFLGKGDFSPPSSPRPTTTYSYTYTNQRVDASAPTVLPSEQRTRVDASAQMVLPSEQRTKVSRVFLSIFNFTVNFVTFRSVRSWLRPTQVSLPQDNETIVDVESTDVIENSIIQQSDEQELADLKIFFPGVFSRVTDTSELIYMMHYIKEKGGGLKGLILFLEEMYPNENVQKIIWQQFVPPFGTPGVDFEETSGNVLFQDLLNQDLIREPAFGANWPYGVLPRITPDLNVHQSPWQNPHPFPMDSTERLTLRPSRLAALFRLPSSGMTCEVPNEPSVPLHQVISKKDHAKLPSFFPGFFWKCWDLSSRAEFVFVMQFIVTENRGLDALEELIQRYGRGVSVPEFIQKNFAIPPGIPNIDYLETPGQVLVKDILRMVDKDSGASSSAS